MDVGKGQNPTSYYRSNLDIVGFKSVKTNNLPTDSIPYRFSFASASIKKSIEQTKFIESGTDSGLSAIWSSSSAQAFKTAHDNRQQSWLDQ